MQIWNFLEMQSGHSSNYSKNKTSKTKFSRQEKVGGGRGAESPQPITDTQIPILFAEEPWIIFFTGKKKQFSLK